MPSKWDLIEEARANKKKAKIIYKESLAFYKRAKEESREHVVKRALLKILRQELRLKRRRVDATRSRLITLYIRPNTIKYHGQRKPFYELVEN